MSRTKGILGISANFEPQIAAPLDARQKVDTRSDLLLAATWTANDLGVYVYIGLTTTVSNDGANNGIYVLIAADYTQITNWLFIAPNVINDALTSLTTTWSSTKLDKKIKQVQTLAYAGL